MTDLEKRVQTWVGAGLIDATQADAILDFEAAEPAHPQATAQAPGGRRGLAPEAVGYVGAALALGAIVLLTRDVWRQLTDPARLGLVTVLAIVLVGAGTALRRVDHDPVQRLASVLGTAGVAAVGWAAAIASGDLIGIRDAALGVTIGAATVATAGVVYLTRPRPLPQLTLLVAILVLVLSSLALPRLPVGGGWFGVAALATGVAWFALASGRWLRPRRVGEAAGAVVALSACNVTFADHAWTSLLLGTLLAAGLVALAITADELHHLVVGALGLFILLPRLVFVWFGGAIGAPALLLVVGLLLVLLAVGLGRARRLIDAEAAEVRR